MSLLTRSVQAVAWPFPARVWAPDAAPPTQADLSGGDPPTWRIARLHAWTGTRLRVIAMRGDKPAVVETIEVVQIEAPDRVRREGELKVWRVTDDQDRVWVIARGAGCGCGHPLKRVRVDQL